MQKAWNPRNKGFKSEGGQKESPGKQGREIPDDSAAAGRELEAGGLQEGCEQKQNGTDRRPDESVCSKSFRDLLDILGLN